MPQFYKQALPYIKDSCLVIPADAIEHHKYWDYDWEGRPGLSCAELLEGLDRADLIAKYTCGLQAHKKGISVKHNDISRRVRHEPKREASFTLKN